MREEGGRYADGQIGGGEGRGGKCKPVAREGI